jgi:hypothetical protein
MRQLTVAASIAAVAVLVTSCGGKDKGGPASSTTTSTTTTTAPPPVAQNALMGVLLTPAELDGVLGVTGTRSASKVDRLNADDAQPFPGGWKWPAECLYASGPGEASVYANSGYTGVSGDIDVAPQAGAPNEKPPSVNQQVVLFPSAKEANAFRNSSASSWPACANRQFSFPGAAVPGGPDLSPTDWKVGPFVIANATLSITLTSTVHAPGGDETSNCQRALTVRNNVAIDVYGCRNNLADLAINVVNQIGGKADSANVNLLAGTLSKGYGLNNCQPAPLAKLTAPAIAELDCGQSPDSPGPISAVYRLLPQADALAADFKNTIQGIALAFCGPNTGQSPGSWQQGPASGQMACGTQNNIATVAWTTNGKNVLSLVRWPNNDINALHDWWLSNG